MNLGIKFAIVLQEEGLVNEDEFVKAVESLGNTGLEVESDVVVFEDDEVVPVRIFYFEGTLASYIRTKLDFNCMENEQLKWVLWPVDKIPR